MPVTTEDATTKRYEHTAAVLGRYRIKSGYTTEDVSVHLGMSLSYTYNIFQGKNIFSLPVAAHAVELLGIPAEEFLNAVRQDVPESAKQAEQRRRQRQREKEREARSSRVTHVPFDPRDRDPDDSDDYC